MPNYKCKNEKCKDFNKVVEVRKETNVICQGQIVCKEQICPSCNQLREVVKTESGYCTTFLGSKNICKK
jgi:hypothetical protein